MRLTDEWSSPILKNCAIIRELHTYGQTVAIAQKIKNDQQHKSLGKQLMAEAEKIAKNEFNFKKVAVIAGIGVREYYKRLGYKLQDTYMIKKLT